MAIQSFQGIQGYCKDTELWLSHGSDCWVIYQIYSQFFDIYTLSCVKQWEAAKYHRDPSLVLCDDLEIISFPFFCLNLYHLLNIQLGAGMEDGGNLSLPLHPEWLKPAAPRSPPALESLRERTKESAQEQICSLVSWLWQTQLNEGYILFCNKRAFKKNTEMLREKLRGKKKVIVLFTLLQCLRRASFNDDFFQVLGLGWSGCQPLHCAHTPLPSSRNLCSQTPAQWPHQFQQI